MPGIDLASLQSRLALSPVKMESLLKRLNLLLEEHGYPIVIRKNKQLWVSLDLEELARLEKKMQQEQLHIPERKIRMILLSLLLFTLKKTSLNSLAERLSVSKNTIVNDLTVIKEKLGDEVAIRYTRKIGYHFIGTEIAIRIMIIRQLHLLLEGQDQNNLLTTYTDVSSHEIYQAKEELLRLEKILHTQFANRQLCLLCLLIPLLKLRVKNYREITTAEYDDIIQMISHKDYQRIIKAMEQAHLYGNASNKEQAFLIIQLLSANVIKSNKEEIVQLSQVIDAVVERFERRAIISFDERDKLKQMLYQHLGPAIYRIKYGIPYEDHDIESIIQEYQAVFPMTKQALRPLENYYQVQFTEVETVYVGLIFQSFLTKGHLMKQKDRLRAVVVCENGVSVSNLLFETLAQTFPTLDFVSNISAREFYENPLVFKDISVVFSTIYLRTTKKIFIISPLLTNEDRQRLIQMVNRELYHHEQTINVEDILAIVKKEACLADEERLRNKLTAYFYRPKRQEEVIFDSKFHRFLPEDQIKVSKRKFSFAEAIQCVAESLLKSGKIEKRFVEKIIECYDERFPYFVIAPEIAIPHAGFNDGVNEVGFSFLKLEHGVRFSAKLSVRALLMIAPIDNFTHQKAVQAFYDCMQQETNRQELFRLQTAAEVKQFFIKKIH